MRVISDPFALDPYIAELRFPGSSVPQTYAPSAVFSLSSVEEEAVMADERLGFVGIVVEDRASVPAVNEILSSFSPIIRGRMGVPDPQGGEAVIGLIVRGTNDQLGALTGRLGNLPGVRAKSALTSAKSTHPQQKRKE